MRTPTSILVSLLLVAGGGLPAAAAGTVPGWDRSDVVTGSTPRAPSMPAYPYADGPRSIDAAKVPGASASISPRVVHPGGRVTVRFGAPSPDVSWSVTDLPGRGAGACAGSAPRGTGVVTCIFTMSDAGSYPRMPQWLTFTVQFTYLPSCFSNGCFGVTTYRAFVALTPAGTAVLSGSVRDRDDRMVRGVGISLAGAGRRYVTATDGAGQFSAYLPQATWTVTPAGSWEPASRVVTLGTGGARADFRAPVSRLDFAVTGSRVLNGVDWTLTDASGLARRPGVLYAHTAAGAPLAGAVVQVDAPYRDGEGPGSTDRPRIAVCDATWRSLFTATDRAERIADGGGQVPFTILAGNEAGTLLWHARLRDDVTALDVERVGLTAPAETGPVVPDITDLIQKGQSLGLAKPPVSAISQVALQSGLVEWWLAYRASPWAGPAGARHTGDVVPVRSQDGRAGALVFYPAGHPAPLRAHLLSGAPIPAGYPTAVLQFRQVLIDIYTGSINGWAVRLDSLPDVATWEAVNGPAVAGYLSGSPGVGAGWLGGPVPPPATDRDARAQYDRCVPGASPSVAVVEVHSPVALSAPAGSGAYLAASTRVGGAVYVVPPGAALGLVGTGAGPARIVVRRGTAASTFTFAAARGVTGSVLIPVSGVPTRARWGRSTVRAVAGVPMTLAGVPTRLSVGRSARLLLRAADVFGASVSGATVVVRGGGVSLTRASSAVGRVAMTLRPSRRGVIRITVTAPGMAGRSFAVAVR